jgi:hypothetical protein
MAIIFWKPESKINDFLHAHSVGKFQMSCWIAFSPSIIYVQMEIKDGILYSSLKKKRSCEKPQKLKPLKEEIIK